MTASNCEIAISGMHCSSCGLLVDETLEDLEGVVRSTTDVRRGRVLIEFEPAVVNIADITAAIEDLGYSSIPPGPDVA